MNNPEFSPQEAMERILARWWIIFILTIMGGCAGWVFHLIQPPIYEATSSLTITLYFEKRDLTQYEQDSALNTAGAIINSTTVTDALMKALQTEGFSSHEINLLIGNRSTEPMESTWELHVRDRDAEVATKAANIWANIAEKTLNDALNHALLTEQLQNQINDLESCLSSATQSPAVTPVACTTYSLEEINTEIQGWAQELATEQALSLGLMPITTISLSRFASVPTQPALYGQASLILAGTCIGFILSLWVTNIRKTQRHD